MPQPAPSHDLTRTVFAVLIIGILIIVTLWVVRPFLPAFIWAVTVSVATWPLLQRMQRLLWGSRGLAVAVMTLIVLIVFVLPFWLATITILGHAGDLAALAQAAVSFRLPPAPHWLETLPLVGPSLAELWRDIDASGLSKLAPTLRPYAGLAIGWLLGSIGGLGRLLIQFLLTVVIVALIDVHAEAGVRLLDRFGRRLAGERGEEMVRLAGRSIRAVAMGVMVTSLVETLIGGLGLWITGVPFAVVLTAVMFVVCVAQAGPGLVLIPAVIWMFVYGGTTMAVVLLLFTILAIVLDNVLRPVLIRRQADLPLLLILVGVLGGLVAFGLIGLFIGPAILAVSYTLMQTWMGDPPAKLSAADGNATIAQ
ncbi:MULTISPECIES: AI-2E family transporter YdiK [unclassified Acidisoma]|uniref:AI-2E family transporter YdiK n=1 Tax=unclassified Acidisoma TaxID=2634065 RepID=UPI00131E5383|nr:MULTISPECIES: AI-2E family transporter YdiK [unclassified Acidisoma]